MKLLVSNLNPTIRAADLTQLFSIHGTVRAVAVMASLETGSDTALGMVRMDSKAQGDAAIAALNGREHRAHLLTVGCATPRQQRGAKTMNVPDASELDERQGLHPGSFGDCSGTGGTAAVLHPARI